MLKFWLVLLTLMLSWPIAFPVQALPCRTIDQQSVCIQDIRRSAKNYWEYRVILKIDGVEQAQEVYNCRDRVKIGQDGTSAPFQPQGVGEFVCRLFRP